MMRVESGRHAPQGEDTGHLFYDQIILDGFDSLDAIGDLARFIDDLLRIDETAQLNDAPVVFDADLE